LERAPRNGQGICYHVMDKAQFWVDTLYMLPPFLAAAGHGDEAVRQYNGVFDAMYDAGTGLLAHMWDDEAKRFERAAHWGTGNGWAAAALARLIPRLPDHREQLVRKATALIDSVLRWMRPDGLFHDVVDDPATFVETNLSQMLAYAIYRGLRDGWLPLRYAEPAEELYRAALGKIDELGFVQGVCGAPNFDKSGLSPEGQAFFLLMCQARMDYLG
ncbi:MAG: glycoside hydrolase family 88 protein, partial [Clostridia bacterium]|nr:glycoside hydrolase family 88 protein [Clostridia bacterium]